MLHLGFVATKLRKKNNLDVEDILGVWKKQEQTKFYDLRQGIT